MTPKTQESGFTLVELMVVATIAVILLVATAPGFRDVINNNRITSQVNRLVSDVQLARAEAMRRGERVVLCRSANPDESSPICGGNAREWSEGWLVFVDADKDGIFTSGDLLVRATTRLKGGIEMLSNAVGAETIQFNADATTNHDGDTLRLVLCDARGSSFGKQINIPPVGRPRLAQAVSSCDSPS